MSILVLAQFHEHVTVLSVKANTQIKKAQGGGSYLGTRLDYTDSDGEPKAAKWQQDWLDNKYQKELKDSIAALKPGDEITLYKEKTIDEETYDAITDPAAKKKAGFWSVKKIYQGHIDPPEQDEKPAKKGAASKKAAPKKQTKQAKSDNDVGMKVGHSVKGATTLLLRLKKPFLEGAKEVYDITRELHKEYAEATGLDDWSAGQTVGNAVLNACFIVSPKSPDVRAAARKILAYIPDITKYIIEQETPVEEPAEPEVEAEEAPEFDDDLPF